MEFHDKCTLKCSEIYIRKTRKFTCNMQKKSQLLSAMGTRNSKPILPMLE